ncbi:heparan-alpha-glucosaminide N-acetyltransferase [Methanobacterium sp.]|uniref:heparan-alpha-glucosaminide N-acetyltransferase n=2 Tax=Methanobacterium sp. TaxID=2164 RepID=UPI003C73CB31
MERSLNERFWEVDSLRGLAILMMITYHFIFDLTFFGIFSFDINSGFWWFFARVTALTFIFLMGVSLTLSSNRSQMRVEGILFKKYFKRGLKIFSLGLLITAATWIFIPQEFIIFGVLHFIGISIILAYPFLKRKVLNLFLGISFIIGGIYLGNFTFDFSWLVWLGFIPNTLQTVDYFPLLPWFGVVLIGLFFGGILYKNYKRQFKLPDLSKNYFIKTFSFLGRNSLIIYLIHQPILIIALYLLGVVNINSFF